LRLDRFTFSVVSTDVIKHWFADKGYGFIKCERGADVFCHVVQVRNSTTTPKAGQRVRSSVNHSAIKLGFSAFP